MDETQIDLRLAFTRAPPFDGRPVFMYCQEHDDTSKPNLAIYPDGMYCFACGFKQQNIHKALEYLNQFDIQVDRVYSGSGLYQKSSKKTVEGNLNESLADLYCNFLFEHRRSSLEYLYKRTLTDKIIRQFKIGHDGVYYRIPIFKFSDGRRSLSSFRLRMDASYADSDSTRYMGIVGTNRSVLYPAIENEEDTRTHRVVVESELCCIRLHQDNIPAVCVTNGVNNLPKILDCLDASRVKTLYIATDVDSAGMEAYKKLQTLDQSRFKIIPVCWGSDLGKDPTEVAQNNAEEFKRIFWKYRS